MDITRSASPFREPRSGRARAVLQVSLVLLLALAGCSRKQTEVAVLRLADGGEIRMRFFDEEAPKTVENFKKLARQGFYDGTRFHRIIPTFIIQGGDPNSKDDDPDDDGYGGPGYTIPDEVNDIGHARGVVSMAHPESPDSAGSQFFIVLADAGPNGESWRPLLDGKYTAFAQVYAGMDVIDRLAELPISDEPPNPDRPQNPPLVASLRIETVQASEIPADLAKPEAEVPAAKEKPAAPDAETGSVEPEPGVPKPEGSPQPPAPPPPPGEGAAPAPAPAPNPGGAAAPPSQPPAPAAP